MNGFVVLQKDRDQFLVILRKSKTVGKQVNGDLWKLVPYHINFSDPSPKMVYGGSCGFTCESQCPPHQVFIQPPPFCVTVPGPILNCYNEPLAVDCNAPCGYGCGGGWGGWGGYGGFGGYGGYGGCGWGGYGYGRGGYGCGVRCGTGYGIRG
ncbi:UNVERIFIED_CONTAM: hypothetical protein K2H54_025691 [Gekko kuhli]